MGGLWAGLGQDLRVDMWTTSIGKQPTRFRKYEYIIELKLVSFVLADLVLSANLASPVRTVVHNTLECTLKPYSSIIVGVFHHREKGTMQHRDLRTLQPKARFRGHVTFATIPTTRY